MQLTSLVLDTNQLTGNIPLIFGNLTNRIYLDLLKNKLTGTIPSTVEKMVQLNDLRLSITTTRVAG